MPASDYVLQTTTKSVCPVCNKHVDLLIEPNSKKKSWFYICWRCKLVLEVGVGIVFNKKELQSEWQTQK